MDGRRASRSAVTCVDTGGSGGLTQAAYEQLRGKQRRNIFAIKGGKGWDKPIASAPSKSRSGKRGRPVTLFTLGVSDAKLIVQRRFNQEKPGPGYCHVPIDRDPEWFHQLTAERLITRFVRGFPVREWKKTRDRNEALDCRVYAYAALKIIDANIPLRLKRLRPADDTEGHTTSSLIVASAGDVMAWASDIVGVEQMSSAAAQQFGTVQAQIDVPDSQTGLARHLASLGFGISFRTARMYTAQDPVAEPGPFYTTATLELG